MECKERHEKHDHVHGENCGHTAIRLGERAGYLHDGHLHMPHGDHVDEASVQVSGRNPERCTPGHSCDSHNSQHKHGPNCGHEQVRHGSHMDYLVGDHLHHLHGNHCDDHGPVEVMRRRQAA